MKFVLKSIREIREEKNMSQAELSRRTYGRVPQGLISELEAGTRQLTGYTAIPIANIFKVDSKDLCLGQEMANNNIPLSKRSEVLKAILGSPELLGASKSINRVKRLDFGDRDSFGIVRKKVEKDKDKKLVDLLDEKDFEQKLKELLVKTS